MNSNIIRISKYVEVLLCLSLMFLIGSCTDKVSVTSYSAQYTNLINYAKTEVQKTRNLTFIRPVNVGFLTRKQYSDYNGSVSSEYTSAILKEFKQIGFIPDTFNNTSFLDSHSDNFAAAFYMPGTDSLYIIDPASNSSVMIFVYAVHELTHALQEQYFNSFSDNIYPSTLQSSLNSDFYISQLCISEGDAELSMVLALYNIFFQSDGFDSTFSYFKYDRDSYYSDLSSESIPRYLYIEGYAPYTLGAWLIINTYNDNNKSWTNVNTLYHANRVNSTADVINSTHETPYTFDFSKVMPLLLKNTTKLLLADDDTYGPVMLMALLNELADTAHCKKAFGWQGDRLAYTLSDDQTYGSFVWAMKFATTDDALYMENLLDQFLTSRTLSGIAPARTTDSTDAIVFTSTNTSTLLKRNGTILLWIENVTEQDSIVTLLSQSALTKRSTTMKTYSTITVSEKQKFLDRLFGFSGSEYVQNQLLKSHLQSNWQLPVN